VNQRSQGTSSRSGSKLSSLDLALVAADLLLNRLIQPGFHTAGPLLVEVLKRNNCNTTGQPRKPYEHTITNRCCAWPYCCLYPQVNQYVQVNIDSETNTKFAVHHRIIRISKVQQVKIYWIRKLVLKSAPVQQDTFCLLLLITTFGHASAYLRDLLTYLCSKCC